jgi:hypothetical protein
MTTKRRKTWNASMIRRAQGIGGYVSGAPWFHLGEGRELNGFLLGEYESAPDPLVGGLSIKFYQLFATKSVLVRDGKGEAANLLRVRAGKVVNLNMGVAIASLSGYIDKVRRGAVYHVTLRYGKKVALSMARSMWSIDLFKVKMCKPTEDEDRIVKIGRELNILKVCLGQLGEPGKLETVGSAIRHLVNSLTLEMRRIEKDRLV